MSLQEAIAAGPQWVAYWTGALTIVAFVLPLSLFVWPQSRWAGILTVLGSVLAGTAVGWLYDTLGYVKLLGLPHIVIWGPLVVYLLGQVRRADMPSWPRRIIWVVIAFISVSLVFDGVDVLRYVMGNRAPVV